MLAPIAWRTPPRHYGPWELFASLLADGLVAAGHDVTLFATADSITTATLRSTSACGWNDDSHVDTKVAEAMHVANAFEHAADFDIVHNGFDFLPLTYSSLVDTPVVTTIHGFSSPRIVPIYERYDPSTTYVALSDADRHPALHYAATIHHGIDTDAFSIDPHPGDHLLFFGRIHPDKGTAHAIEVARRCGRRLDIAGNLGQDEADPGVSEGGQPVPVDEHSADHRRALGLRAEIVRQVDDLRTVVGEDRDGARRHQPSMAVQRGGGRRSAAASSPTSAYTAAAPASSSSPGAA